MEALTPLDMTDDRLADVLRLLSDDERARAFEQEVMGHLVRVSHWDARGVRVDTTTVSSDADVSEEGWLPLGHSNDHRPDLGPWKIALARVDPCGMPLATDVLSGEHADDPVSVPLINRVREGLARTGVLDVGDSNMAAAHTRASVQAQEDFYLCPLSALHVSAAQVAQEVEAHRGQNHPLIEVMREGEQGTPICMAQGYESTQEMSVLLGEPTTPWQERRVLVQSMAAQTAARSRVLERLEKAEQALRERAVRTQGTPRLTSRVQGDEQVASLLSSFRVEGVLQVQIQEEVHEQPVRASRGKVSSPRTIWNVQMRVERMPEAITTAISVLGWRVDATNQLAASLERAQAVEASWDAYLVERNVSRLTGHPLSLGPLSVQRDDHRVGLVRLLTIALRVLTVLEGVVRQHLAQHQHALAGLCAGTPKRSTTQPPAERLLEAFREIRLLIVSAPGVLTRHVTPLSSLQQQIVPVCGFSSAVSVCLADDS